MVTPLKVVALHMIAFETLMEDHVCLIGLSVVEIIFSPIIRFHAGHFELFVGRGDPKILATNAW
jgi:hypothetical protein